MRTSIAVAAIILALGTGHAVAAQPYAGLAEREIKALSDQEIADLRAGRGMGLALAAELNGYPGPLHVLELAGDLDLTAEQHRRVQDLYESMKAEAAGLGARVIELEAALERGFAERAVTPESLEALTAEIGRARAALRATHLGYHLTTTEVLTSEQVETYAVLRGYRGRDAQGHHGHGGHQAH
jgi:hypothetical protein